MYTRYAAAKSGEAVSIGTSRNTRVMPRLASPKLRSKPRLSSRVGAGMLGKPLRRLLKPEAAGRPVGIPLKILVTTEWFGISEGR